MRAECYLLHIYCDNKHDCKVFGRLESEEFTGKNKTEAHKNARAHGWRIGKRDVCPTCLSEVLSDE